MLGLKTGGTLQQCAEKLFLTKHTPLEKLDRKHFAKGSRGSEQNGVAAALQQTEDWKEIVLTESKMEKLCDLLEDVILCFVLVFSFIIEYNCNPMYS